MQYSYHGNIFYINQFFNYINILLEEMEEIVGLLCEVAPDYFSTTVLNERKYVQLKKNEYAAILTIIRKEISNFKVLY